LLLAVFDLLMVRAQTRAARKLFEQQFRKGSAPDPPNQAGD
jgi:hypothetical protein